MCCILVVILRGVLFQAMLVVIDTKNLCYSFFFRVDYLSCNKYRLDTLFVFMFLCVCKNVHSLMSGRDYGTSRGSFRL